MKKTVLLLFISLLPVCLFAQKDYDIGIGFGAYSMHEHNILPFPGSEFGFVGGALYRYNFNPRHAMRVSVNAGQSLSGLLVDGAALFEFNFLPLTRRRNKDNFTPYINSGLGYYKNKIVIPFGLGVKMNLSESFGFGVDWNLRKSFGNLVTEGFVQSLANWDSFIGLYVNFKIVTGCKTCAFYD